MPTIRSTPDPAVGAVPCPACGRISPPGTPQCACDEPLENRCLCGAVAALGAPRCPACGRGMWRTALRERVRSGRRAIALTLAACSLMTGAVVFVHQRRSAEFHAIVEAASRAAENGDLSSAESAVRDVLTKRPKDNRARSLLVSILLETGRRDEAEREARHVIALDPQHRFAQGTIARLARSRDDAETSLRHAERAGELALDERIWALRRLGRDGEAAVLERDKARRSAATLSDALSAAISVSAVTGSRSTDARAAWRLVREISMRRILRRAEDLDALAARAREADPGSRRTGSPTPRRAGPRRPCRSGARPPGCRVSGRGA